MYISKTTDPTQTRQPENNYYNLPDVAIDKCRIVKDQR